MANVTTTQKAPKALSRGQLILLRCLERGEGPAEIARRKYPKLSQERERSKLREKLWYEIKRPEIIAAVQERSTAGLMVGLGPAVKGLSKRASRRHADAKLLLEATGVHNPRIKHEHSGDVTIKLDLPRPTFAQDAEPVEDDD